MTNTDWTKVYQYLEGTCHSATDAIYYFDLDCTEEEVEEKMLELNLEVCPGCGWWVESYELVDENGELVYCDHCR